MAELSKRKRMTNAELNARKRVGSRVTQAGAVTSLGSVAALGSAYAVPKLARSGRLTRWGVDAAKAEKFKGSVRNKLIASGAIGGALSGANGLNSAAVQREELRRRNVLKKSDDRSPFEDGFYGEVGVTDLRTSRD